MRVPELNLEAISINPEPNLMKSVSQIEMEAERVPATLTESHPRRHLSCLGVCAVNEHTYLNIPVYWWLSIQKARLSGGLHEHFTRYF